VLQYPKTKSESDLQTSIWLTFSENVSTELVSYNQLNKKRHDRETTFVLREQGSLMDNSNCVDDDVFSFCWIFQCASVLKVSVLLSK